MLFKKNYEELVAEAINGLQTYTDITNVSIGGIARSLLEIVNKQLSDYYDVLEINHAMGFLSSAEGYFLDLLGGLLNVTRLEAAQSSASVIDENQKFYVTKGTLGDVIPTLQIEKNTTVKSSDGTIVYNVSEDITFAGSAIEVYVPITAAQGGADYNVGKSALLAHSLDVQDVYTVNTKAIVNGSDTETDDNYRYRIANATLAAEKANETAIRLAALSVDGVSDVVMRAYTRGIGSFEVLVIPTEGLADASLLGKVQSAIDKAQAYGIRGLAAAPTVVPIDIEVRIVFVKDTTEEVQDDIREEVKISIDKYAISIPVGGDYILNELRQQIMDVSPLIKDHKIHCYYFREQPHILGNVLIYDDEMFYPNPDSIEATRVV